MSNQPGGFGPPPQGGFGPPPPGGFGPPPQGGFGPPPPGGFGPPPQGGYGPPQGGYGLPGPQRPVGPPQYEFSALENETIGNVAKWAKYLAVALFIYGGLSAMGCNVLYVIGYIAVGVPVFMAGNAFQRVVDTQGRDLTNMMDAVQALGTSFLVRIVVMVAMVVLTLLFLVLGLLFIGMIASWVASTTR